MRETIRREADVVDPIMRKARGDGRWTVTTASGEELGTVYRETRTAPNGRRYRETGVVRAADRLTLCQSLATAIWVLAFERLSPSGDPIDQQDYLRFIAGARLKAAGLQPVPTKH